MRLSDFKKGTVIEIVSGEGRYCYAQVIHLKPGFAPLLALLGGVFNKCLSIENIKSRRWALKKYTHVNPSSPRTRPSVWTWKAVGRELDFLYGVSPPKALVHGDKISDWKIVFPDGRKEYFEGDRHSRIEFENMGYAIEIIWLSVDIEKYMFDDVELVFPDR